MRRFDPIKASCFLRRLRGASRGIPRRFVFLPRGRPERDPLRRVVVGIPRFTFTSHDAGRGMTANRCESVIT